MDLIQLEHFLAVADERTFTRAAERVFRTQPALSQSIKKLEMELGSPLFVRDNGNVSLTEAGSVLADYAHRMLKLRDEALAGLAKIPGVTCVKPEGAFYVYPNISAYIGKGGIRTATELATRLLHEAHVVTVPGEAFGTAEHIRISYPVTKENIDEGTRRMGEFLTGLA